MAKSRKKKPYTPPTTWDKGPDTPAARRMSVSESAGDIDPQTGKRVDPNAVRRRRRLCVAELYHRKGHITKRQFTAAMALLLAWERNQRGPAAIKEIQVDTSPKPDASIAITIDRISKYHAVARLIPKQYQAFVMHVARDNNHITSMPGYRRNVHMDRLRKGLDALADGIERR